MEIIVEQAVKLVSDSNGWSLRTYRPLSKGPRQGQLDWAEDGHYDTLQWALVGAFKRCLSMGRGVADLPALARRIDHLEQRLLSIAGQALELQITGGVPGVAEDNPWAVEAPPVPGTRRTASGTQLQTPPSSLPRRRVGP